LVLKIAMHFMRRSVDGASLHSCDVLLAAVIAASSTADSQAPMSLSRARRKWLAPAVMVIAAGGTALLVRGEAPAAAPAPAPPPAVSPARPPTPAAPPTAPPAADTVGLRLRGILGYSGGNGAAIFAMPDGRQRHVAVGSEIAPGVRLERIAGDHALVHDGVQTLEFSLPEMTDGDTGAPAAVAVVATLDPKRELANFRLGLKPVGDVARPRGYRIVAGVPLPMFDGAGLKPGDVVLAVNGQTLDEERLLDLPAELFAATSVEIAYERGGRQMTATIAR
jgi:general secretion pathway protein C